MWIPFISYVHILFLFYTTEQNNVSVGNGLDQTKCVPFVSQYTDCTDENKCPGCTKCSCTAAGEWSCEPVKECDEEDVDNDQDEIDDLYIENAMKTIETEIKNKRIKEAQSSKTPFVPFPKKSVDKDVLLDYKLSDPMDEVMDMLRQKRSTSKGNGDKANDTIKFYGVVNEVNEDTLKSSNLSGTLQAHKVDIVTNLSRRTGALDTSNSSLQIEFSEPNRFSLLTDNKIDTGHNEAIFDLSREKLHEVLGNRTQATKDKELSKLIVNELKKGNEIIGDSAAPVISNVTFTPENDTLTAMTFIAGNLLNKLWSIEKDAGGTSLDTEMIKHEKITSLLDLFKESLTLKQEFFLKNVLVQLSNAIDKTKDIKNASICENIEESKKLLDDSSGESSDTSIDSEKKERTGCIKSKEKKEDGAQAQDVISKVSKVMTLIEKFDGIKKKITGLKKTNDRNIIMTETQFIPVKNIRTNGVFTSDEKESLNQFENLLSKFTEILNSKDKPNKNKYKITNLHATNENIKNKLKNTYNIDLGNMTVTTKDKIIFDYLSHIEANPECLLKVNNRKSKSKSLVNMEGNILLNLSEFFKIKSFSDLIKLVDTTNVPSLQKVTTTSENPIESTTTTEKIYKNENVKYSTRSGNTKDKLKAHLRAILEDLIEIQNAKGVNGQTDAQLIDALPCIYNILNADKQLTTNKTLKLNPSENVAKILNKLKTDLKMAQTRRSGTSNPKPRPKSAVVWERTVKNLHKNSRALIRRHFESKEPKSLEGIKKMIDKIESSGSNTYKKYALLVEVPAVEKLVLLKTLASDVDSFIKALEEIKLTISTMDKLPADKHLELMEFVNNVATNIQLNDRIVIDMNKSKDRRDFVDEMNSSGGLVKSIPNKKQNLRVTTINENKNGPSVTRDVIINQLIRNRVELYIKLKESKGVEDTDMNYIIAKKILMFLDSGNNKLARELYKIFVTQKENNTNSNAEARYKGTNLLKINEDVPYVPIQQKQPLIQFAESKPAEHSLNWFTQDHLIKQLLNTKTLNG